MPYLPAAATSAAAGAGGRAEIGQLGSCQFSGFAHGRVAVARVATRTEPPGSNPRKHLLHHLTEVGRRQRFDVDPFAEGTVTEFETNTNSKNHTTQQ